MKRRSFILLSAAVVSLAAIPFAVKAQTTSKKRNAKGFAVEAGRDRFDKSISIFQGDAFYCKVSTGDTNGTCMPSSRQEL